MREMSGGLLLGLFQVSSSSFEMSFTQEIRGSARGCYISQGSGNGRLHDLNSISCPHKAGLRVLVLTERNEAFLSVEEEEILFC